MKKIREFIKTLLFALFFAGIIRSFLFEPFHIPSSSMKPNLLIGDYIIVSKYSYGYSRFSFPFGFNFFEGRFLKKNLPKRGEVAVFRYPRDVSINYIKRVVGLPGDSIQMKNGVLFINDKEVKKSEDGFFYDEDSEIFARKIEQNIEEFDDGKKIKTLDSKKNAMQDDTAIFLVPDGHYFMMGDNRDNSQDSRFLTQVGFVPEENLIGEARFIFFSNSKPFWEFWNWPNSIRFSRIFQEII